MSVFFINSLISDRVCGKAEELVLKRDLSEVFLDHHPETQFSVEPDGKFNNFLSPNKRPKSPCQTVGVYVGSPPWWQSLKVLIVDDERHPARPRGHAVGHVVPCPKNGGRLDDDVAWLQRGVREVEALHLAPRVLIDGRLAAVGHQAGVEDKRVLVLEKMFLYILIFRIKTFVRTLRASAWPEK